MGFFSGFLETNETPTFLTTPTSTYKNYEPSAAQLGHMMAWLNDVAANMNINGGSFTWKRQLTGGAATTFTPSLTAPHGLEGSLMTQEVVNQIKTNLQLLGTHFGWDFSTYPPANFYGEALYNLGGGSYFNYGYSCPGFPGSIPVSSFDSVQYQWPPSDVLNFGAPTRHYMKDLYPLATLSNDYFEGFPYVYGPLSSETLSRSSVKNRIPTTSGGDGAEEIYRYKVFIEGDATQTDTGGTYSESTMLAIMASAWSSFQAATPTVTELGGLSSAQNGFSASGEALLKFSPTRVEYNAKMFMQFSVNLHYIRGKAFEDIFGADPTHAPSGTKGYWCITTDNLPGYFVLNNSGYAYSSAATRLSIVTPIITSILAASWTSIGATLGSMVTTTGNMLCDVVATRPYPTSSPYPGTAPELTPTSPFWIYYQFSDQDSNNIGDFVTTWGNKTRHQNINPHLFASGILEEEAPPPP